MQCRFAPTRPQNGRRWVENSEDGRRAGVARRAAAAALILLLGGCASAPRLPEAPVDTAALCRAQIARVDAAVADAGVGDAGAARIEGFPWLRVTRPLASFRDEVDDDARFEAWLGHLSATAHRARRHELENLPADRRAALTREWADRAAEHDLAPAPLAGLADCRRQLNRSLSADTDARARLRNAAVAPDAYRTWQRVIGLYPLARRIARPQVVDYQQERDAAFGEPADVPVRRYAVPARSPASAPIDAAAVARGIERDVLDIPRPGPQARAQLFDAHAPVWAVATASEADHPGALRLDEQGRPVAGTNRPAEYRSLSWTRFGESVLLQLNYLIWFPERPSTGALDLYAGHLDGLIWRVTLGPDGRPLAYDSIHPCGCYYTLFPTAGWRVATVPPDQEPVASPRRAPARAADERLVVRLEHGTHYLADLTTARRPVEAHALAPLPYGHLRSLPARAGGSESAFAPDGLIPSTARPERFLFWPLGVPSAGAMRQDGTHAVAFIGRRHFDDPRLLEQLLRRTADDPE